MSLHESIFSCFCFGHGLVALYLRERRYIQDQHGIEDTNILTAELRNRLHQFERSGFDICVWKPLLCYNLYWRWIMESVNKVLGNDANRSYPGFFVNDGVWHVKVYYPRRINGLEH